LAVSTTTKLTQPALLGGLVIGVLSSLPIIAAGNLCCCLWVVSGGLVAAYVLQQQQPTPITQADGALAGLLAGIFGAFVYLVLSIPITFLVAPMEQRVFRSILDNAGNMPPEFRDMFEAYGQGGRYSTTMHVARFAIGFVMMLVVGAIFSTLGGLLGAIFFRKPLPPGTIDVTPPPAP